MSIGDPYATLADLMAYRKMDQASDQEIQAMNWALATATTSIDDHCGRQFNLSDTPSQRIYAPARFAPREIEVDDFVLTDDFLLETDPGATGTFDVTWQPTDYELEPFNGVVGGVPGFPFNEIHATAGVWFPLVNLRRRGTVRVTALWGWAAVPNNVHQACLVLASENFKLADAPFGVAGFSPMGYTIKVKQGSTSEGLLCKFVLDPVLGG